MVEDFVMESFPRNIQTVDDSSPEITFSGSGWTTIDASNATTDIRPYCREAWGARFKRTTTLGDKIIFSFIGTAILGRFLLTPGSSTMHRYRIDGGGWITLDLYSETIDWSWIVLAYNLPKGMHTVEIQNNEQGKELNFDAFRYETEMGALQVDAMIEARISAKVEMAKGLGRTDWLPTVEQAPATGVYFANPTDIGDGDYTAILMDIKRRVRIMPFALEDLDTSITRDASGKITQMQITDALTGKVATLTFTYDSQGNIISISKTIS